MYRLIVLILVVLASSLVSAQTTQAVDEKLQEIDRRAAAIKDLTATFEQRKISPLLKKPLVSRGTVSAKDAQMLWVTDSPRQTVMRVDATAIQLLYVEDKVLEIYPVDGKLAQMAASPLPRLGTMKDQFDIQIAEKSDSHITLNLRPTDKILAEYVEQVVVVIAIQSGVIEQFELTDPDGEKTVIRFSDHKINTGLTDADLKIDPPAGTKTVRPLDGAR